MKKLIVIFAILAFAYSQMTGLGSYKEIGRQEIENSAALKAVLDFGTQEFIKQASQENKLSDPNLTLSNIESAYRQVVAGINYKFNVNYTDSKGKTLSVTLVVYSKPWENKTELTSYEIKN